MTYTAIDYTKMQPTNNNKSFQNDEQSSVRSRSNSRSDDTREAKKSESYEAYEPKEKIKEPFSFGFERLLGQIKDLKLDVTSELKTQGIIDDLASDALLLSESDLANINPDLFLKNINKIRQISDADLAGQLKGLLAQLRQIVIKLGLQTVGADGKIMPVDLEKVDLSKLNLDEFNLLKKLAFADIRDFLNTPITVDASGKLVIDKQVLAKKLASLDKQIDKDLEEALGKNNLLALLDVLQKLQIQTPVTPDGTVQIVVLLDGKPVVQTQPKQIDEIVSEQNSVNSEMVIDNTDTNLLAAQGLVLAANNTNNNLPKLPVFVPVSGVTNAIENTSLAKDVKDSGKTLQSFAEKNLISALLAPATAQKSIQALRLNPAAASIASQNAGLFGSEDNLTDFGLNNAATATGFSSLVSGGTVEQGNFQAQKSHATQTHIVTEQVQVNLQKLAARANRPGENNLTIQLDPAELGRVRIKISFFDDGLVKARLTMERPETMALLQKDQDILQRSLQNIGVNLDTDGGLSFDLSQGQNFSGQFGDSQSGQTNKEYGEGFDDLNDDVNQADLANNGEITVTNWVIDDGRLNIKV